MKKTPDGPRSCRTRVNALMVAGKLLIPLAYYTLSRPVIIITTLDFKGDFLEMKHHKSVREVKVCMDRGPELLFIFRE